jgi:predicted metal-dependent HD superfamily phosphohydrolase
MAPSLRLDDEALAYLTELYSEPHRYYHRISHIISMLFTLWQLKLSYKEAQLLELAIWFHDAVYDPKSSTNEEDSAKLAAEYCNRVGIPSDPVVRLIKITATHKVEPGDTLGAIISDLDMRILGLDQISYSLYTLQVRQEYSHLTNEEWSVGRKKFLLGLLGRPIYHSEFSQDLEPLARQNIQHELELLK